jgi:hypothetical protein
MFEINIKEVMLQTIRHLSRMNSQMGINLIRHFAKGLYKK